VHIWRLRCIFILLLSLFLLFEPNIYGEIRERRQLSAQTTKTNKHFVRCMHAHTEQPTPPLQGDEFLCAAAASFEDQNATCQSAWPFASFAEIKAHSTMNYEMCVGVFIPTTATQVTPTTSGALCRIMCDTNGTCTHVIPKDSLGISFVAVECRSREANYI
jgi:hypothetical protein